MSATECPIFPPPDHPSKCSWSLKADKSLDPHPHHRQIRAPVCPNVLNHIGNTPLIRLNKIPANYGVKCQVLAKCEFFNPGGSVKDRIALRMIEDAEQKGIIEPGWTLIEPTSGNLEQFRFFFYSEVNTNGSIKTNIYVIQVKIIDLFVMRNQTVYLFNYGLMFIFYESCFVWLIS